MSEQKERMPGIIPVEFEMSNIVIGANQEGVHPLPAFIGDSETNVPVVTCWKLSWKDRFRVFTKGRIYIHESSFGTPISPKSLYSDLYEIFDKKALKNLEK